MGELIRLVLNEIWQRLIQPLLKKTDQWDLWFLTLFLAGFAYWYWLWTEYCSFSERILWGALLLIIATIWFLARIGTRKQRLRNILIVPRRQPSTTSSSRSRRLLLIIKITPSVLLTTLWFYAAREVYRIPLFEGEVTGLYIACLEGDVGGVYQTRIVQYIGDHIKQNGLERLVNVKALPRRIEEEEITRAREFGMQGKATLVLWGNVSGSQKLRSHMTAVNAEGFYRAENLLGRYSGHQGELNNFSELPQELETLGYVLAIFLAGYNHYQAQRYMQALPYFNAAKQKLTVLTEMQQGPSPEKAMLGSIEFYIGNVNYFESEAERVQIGRSPTWQAKVEEATKQYKIAVDLTSHPIERNTPQYIEPLNNLGYLLIDRNLEGALEPLKQALTLCQMPKADQTKLCSLIKYNLGEVKRRLGDFHEAVQLFEQAIAELERVSQNELHSFGLLPYLYQAAAFAYVRLADSSDSEQSRALYDKAESKLQKAREILTNEQSTEAQLLLTYNEITKARIHIGHKRWQDAIQILDPVVKRFNDPDVNLLLSIAYACTQRVKEAEANFNVYFEAYKTGRIDDRKWQEDTEHEKRTTTQCRPAGPN